MLSLTASIRFEGGRERAGRAAGPVIQAEVVENLKETLPGQGRLVQGWGMITAKEMKSGLLDQRIEGLNG